LSNILVVDMETLTDKTIETAPNILRISSNEKRQFKLEPVEPMSIPQILSVLDGLKKIDKNFEFRILWG
jgi:hypothetical protein